MKRKLLLGLAALAAACGGNVLDVGPPGSGGADASPDPATPDAGDVVPWPLPGQRNARALTSEGAYLYWLANQSAKHVLLRCEKADCGHTVTAVSRPAVNMTLLGFAIRGDMIYLVADTAFFSCPLADCSAPKLLVYDVKPIAAAFDDAHIYWSQQDVASGQVLNKILSCPLTGCAKPNLRLNGVMAVDLLVDDSRLYWIAGNTYPGISVRISSMPKDGSGPVTHLVDGQNQLASFALHDGFVYFTTSTTLGTIARCPVTGCDASGPEVLADRQNYPNFVNPSADGLFWMNGPAGPDIGRLDRPVQIVGCQMPACGSSIETLDQGTGGGFALRANAYWNGTDVPALPAREMVTDDDAIYWIGDLIGRAPPGQTSQKEIDASIRRTEKRRIP
ncbi:MAG: hypothetical protein ABW133_16980 [Polyangiaceae bacterium]